MAEDVREAILVRLKALLAGLGGGIQVVRNEIVDDDGGEQGRKQRIVILEGDEATPEKESTNMPAHAPRTVYMHPQIMLCNFAGSAAVGAGLSAMRGKVIKAIATDEALIALTIKRQGGLYLGMESDLGFARAMNGEATLKFQFAYLLRPDQF
jgi:hypothetical protein